MKKLKQNYEEDQTPVERLRNKLSPFMNLIKLLELPGVQISANKESLFKLIEKELENCKRLTPEILDHLDDIEPFYEN